MTFVVLLMPWLDFKPLQDMSRVIPMHWIIDMRSVPYCEVMVSWHGHDIGN